MIQSPHRKPLFWTNVIALTILGMTVAGVIFGWNNPLSTPPNPPGSVTASSGNVGIGTSSLTPGARLTVNGILDMLTNRVTSVAAPQVDSDAATRGYVLAQVGGAGTASVTLYGQANQTGSNPSAGQGLPACSTLGTNWVEAYAGYGPHWIGIDQVFETSPTTGGQTVSIVDSTVIDGGAYTNIPAYPNHIVSRVAYGSDSVCSTANTSVIPMTPIGNPGITAINPIGRARACGEGLGFGGAGSGTFFCNVCRVCIKP